jgi:hypothetical protein
MSVSWGRECERLRRDYRLDGNSELLYMHIIYVVEILHLASGS